MSSHEDTNFKHTSQLIQRLRWRNTATRLVRHWSCWRTVRWILTVGSIWGLWTEHQLLSCMRNWGGIWIVGVSGWRGLNRCDAIPCKNPLLLLYVEWGLLNDLLSGGEGLRQAGWYTGGTGWEHSAIGRPDVHRSEGWCCQWTLGFVKEGEKKSDSVIAINVTAWKRDITWFASARGWVCVSWSTNGEKKQLRMMDCIWITELAQTWLYLDCML